MSSCYCGCLLQKEVKRVKPRHVFTLSGGALCVVVANAKWEHAGAAEERANACFLCVCMPKRMTDWASKRRVLFGWRGLRV